MMLPPSGLPLCMVATAHRMTNDLHRLYCLNQGLDRSEENSARMRASVAAMRACITSLFAASYPDC